MSDEVEDNQWEIDQAERGYKDIARLYASLYHGLMYKGVPAQAAMVITAAHVHASQGRAGEGD